MIDLSSEQLISVTQAAKRCPTRPHVATVWRWIRRGCRGVRLETVLVGGKRRTSAEALDRFYAQITSVAGGGSADDSVPTRDRNRAIRSANEYLDRHGI